MDNNNIIKSLFPQTCPHCKKDIIVAIQTSSPVIAEIITEEDVIKAKTQVREAAQELFTGEELSDTLKWVNDDNTVFGLKDVNSIIASFKK